MKFAFCRCPTFLPQIHVKKYGETANFEDTRNRPLVLHMHEGLEAFIILEYHNDIRPTVKTNKCNNIFVLIDINIVQAMAMPERKIVCKITHFLDSWGLFHELFCSLRRSFAPCTKLLRQ